MYNLQSCSCDDAISVVTELHSLRHLDLSDDRGDNPFNVLMPHRCKVSGLLRQINCLPHLVSLDISGKDDIEVHDLK